MVNIKV